MAIVRGLRTVTGMRGQLPAYGGFLIHVEMELGRGGGDSPLLVLEEVESNATRCSSNARDRDC